MNFCTKWEAVTGESRLNDAASNILAVPNVRDHLSPLTILAQIASDDVLASASQWLCRRRRDYSANADVWAFRRCWPRANEQIKDELHRPAGSCAAL